MLGGRGVTDEEFAIAASIHHAKIFDPKPQICHSIEGEAAERLGHPPLTLSLSCSILGALDLVVNQVDTLLHMGLHTLRIPIQRLNSKRFIPNNSCGFVDIRIADGCQRCTAHFVDIVEGATGIVGGGVAGEDGGEGGIGKDVELVWGGADYGRGVKMVQFFDAVYRG